MMLVKPIATTCNRMDTRFHQLVALNISLKGQTRYMVSHRGHNCIFSALTILDSALTS